MHEYKELPIKYVSAVRGEGSLSSQTFCGQGERGGSSDSDVCTFWCKNLSIFRNL